MACEGYSEGLREQFADGVLGLGSITYGAWPDGNKTEHGGMLAGLGVKEFGVDFEKKRIIFRRAEDQNVFENVKLEEELSTGWGGWVVRTRWEEDRCKTEAVALLDTGSAVTVTPDFDTARSSYGSTSRDIRPIDSLGS